MNCFWESDLGPICRIFHVTPFNVGNVATIVRDSLKLHYPGFHLGGWRKSPVNCILSQLEIEGGHTPCQQEVGAGKNSIFGVERPPLTQKCAVARKTFLCSVLLDLPKERRAEHKCRFSRLVSSWAPKIIPIKPHLKNFRFPGV